MAREWYEGWLGRLWRCLCLVSPGRSLQGTLFVFAVLGLVMIMAAFVVLSLRTVQESRDKALNDRLVLAAVVARNLDLVMQLLQDDLADEASRLVFDPQEGITEEHKSFLRWAAQHLAVFNYRISLVDRFGTVRWVEPYEPSLLGASFAGRSFARETLADPRPRISNLIRVRSGKPMVALHAPISDREGRFSGYLSGEIDLAASDASKFIPTIELGATGYVEVIDGLGNLLISSSPAAEVSGNYDARGHNRDLVAGGQPRIGTCYRCHEGPEGLIRERETIAFYPLSVAPWGVAVRQLESETMADLLQLQQEFLWVGLAVLIVASSLVWIAIRVVFRPLRSLTAAATRISQGDFDITIPRTRGNEIGELAESFEEMRVKVKGLLEEERCWREGLETQVRDATKDLASLYEVSQAVNRASLNLQELLGAALGKVVEALEPADAGILLLEERGRGLVPAASVGYNLADLSGVVMKRGEGISGKALQQGPVACNSREAMKESRRTLSKKNKLLLDRAAASLGPVKSALALPLAHAGRTQGVLVIVSHDQEGAFSPGHISLAQSVADQVATGLANARLHAELQQREASRGDLLRKLISAQEEERRRVARELHDEAGQALTAVMMSASRAEQALPPEMQEFKVGLVEARARASQALDDVRRLILDLRPQVLDDLGLIPALRWFVKNRLQSVTIEGRLEISGIKGRLPGQIEVTVFRVVQEALTNIIRHSEAARVTVHLSLRDSLLTGTVEDDGKGFEAEKVLAAQTPQEGWGLRGMEERIHLLGGNLSVKSQPGRGTRVHFQIPLESVQEGVLKNEQDTSTNS